MFECDWRLPCLAWIPALTLTPALSQMEREKAVYASPRLALTLTPALSQMEREKAVYASPGFRTLTPALSQMEREKAVYASPGFRPRIGVPGMPSIGGMTNSVAGTIHPGSESGTCFRTKTGGGLASPRPSPKPHNLAHS